MYLASKQSVRGARGLGLAIVLSVSMVFASRASAGVIYAIDDQNSLFTFDNLAPQNILTGTFLSGLKPNEHLINIDFHPIPDRIRFFSDTENNVRIDPTTGLVANVDTNLAYKAGDPNFGKNPN